VKTQPGTPRRLKVQTNTLSVGIRKLARVDLFQAVIPLE
jgi:hypothetical protein